MKFWNHELVLATKYTGNCDKILQNSVFIEVTQVPVSRETKLLHHVADQVYMQPPFTSVSANNHVVHHTNKWSF